MTHPTRARRVARSALIGAALALAGCFAPRNLLDREIRIVERPYAFVGESLELLAGLPPDVREDTPLAIWLEGDGTYCQGYGESLWRRTLVRFTGHFVLARPVTLVNTVCETDRFRALDFLHRVDELETIVAAARAVQPGGPLYLIGHSAGAHVAVMYADRHPGVVAGIVNLGGGVLPLADVLPAIEVERVLRGEQTAEEAAARSCPIDAALAEVREHADASTPFWGRTHHFWAQMFFSDVARLWREAAIPVLIAHGTEDIDAVPYHSVMASRGAFAAAGLTHAEFRFYPGLGHDLATPEVMRDVDAWITAHAAHR